MLICACWLLFLFYFVSILTPALAGMAYDSEMSSFHYNGNGTFVSALKVIDDNFTAGFPILTFIIYGVILLLLIRRVSTQYTPESPHDDGNLLKRHRYGQNAALMTTSELRVLIQSVTIFGVFAAMSILKKVGTPTPGFIYGTTLLWQAECGTGPVLYLCMNARVRQCAWEMVMCHRSECSTTTPVSRMNYK